DQLVEISGTQAQSIHLVFAGGAIRGSVIDSQGVPIAHATVMELTSHATAVSDEQGNFDIHGVPIGKCRVQARSGARASSVEDIIVSADATASVNLYIADHPDTIRVRVLTADGAAAAGAFVFAAAGAGSIETVTTDMTGASEIAFPGGSANRA